MHYSADEWLLYLQSLNTCADCESNSIILMTGREGVYCIRVSCAKILLVKFDDPVKMVPSKHGGVAYMQLSCIDG